MPIITRRGVAMNTVGELPAVGTNAPALNNLMTKDWLKFQSSQVCAGKFSIIYIVPSFDTPTCEKSTVRFNQEASQLSNTVVLGVSKDLPPAISKFCGAKDIRNVFLLSAYRSDCQFGDDFGMRIVDGAGEEGAFKDLFGRALIALNPNGQVIYSELVVELANEPNYDACLNAIKANQLQSSLLEIQAQSSSSSAASTLSTSSASSSSAVVTYSKEAAKLVVANVTPADHEGQGEVRAQESKKQKITGKQKTLH